MKNIFDNLFTKILAHYKNPDNIKPLVVVIKSDNHLATLRAGLSRAKKTHAEMEAILYAKLGVVKTNEVETRFRYTRLGPIELQGEYPQHVQVTLTDHEPADFTIVP